AGGLERAATEFSHPLSLATRVNRRMPQLSAAGRARPEAAGRTAAAVAGRWAEAVAGSWVEAGSPGGCRIAAGKASDRAGSAGLRLELRGGLCGSRRRR